MIERHDYTIRAYLSLRSDDLVIETWHDGVASKNAEIAAFRVRMRSGEIAYIEVYSYVDPVGFTQIFEASHD